MLAALDELLRRTDAGEAVACCVVVRTRGSTPQKAPALMLVLQSGQSIGTLGGGCVEAEVRTRALAMIQGGQSRLLRFTLDHDYGWDDGLVCGGAMEIAVQSVATAADAAAWRALHQALAARRVGRLMMAVDDEAGTAHSFDLPIDPRPMLVIAGGGHVGTRLAGVCATADFDLTVIDDRPEYAAADRLPPGARCVVGPVEQELGRLTPDGQTYVVIVTRGHRNDAAALRAVVGRGFAYVGLIGSRRKIVTIFADLASGGVSEAALAQVHAPIGLDIGAVTPGEIAVSIAAELIAVRRRGANADPVPMRLTDQQVRAAAARG